MLNIKNDNYYVVKGFMVKDLKLKGKELSIFAIIYGFSQFEGQWFNGDLNYLADWVGYSKSTIEKSIFTLLEKGYITKREVLVNNVRVVEYKENYSPTLKEKMDVVEIAESTTPNTLIKEQDILDYWNTKNIVVHRELNNVLHLAIKYALKSYSVDEIKVAIDRYNIVLKDEDYFINYPWRLEDFLKRYNGLPYYARDGIRWKNYLLYKDEHQHATCVSTQQTDLNQKELTLNQVKTSFSTLTRGVCLKKIPKECGTNPKNLMQALKWQLSCKNIVFPDETCKKQWKTTYALCLRQLKKLCKEYALKKEKKKLIDFIASIPKSVAFNKLVDETCKVFT